MAAYLNQLQTLYGYPAVPPNAKDFGLLQFLAAPSPRGSTVWPLSLPATYAVCFQDGKFKCRDYVSFVYIIT